MRALPLSIAAGTLLAAVCTASPLTIVVLPAAWVVLSRTGRGLPADERRALFVILLLAFGARLAAIGLLFVVGIPGHSDISVGGLAGDDAYYLSRAIRARDVVLGFAAGKYDYFVVTDEYGQTSYLQLLTWLQVLAGPTPYGMRVLNAMLFVTGAGVLFRTARDAFGVYSAFVGLIVLLFLPSLFLSSISLLKESVWLLVSSILLASVIRSVKAPRVRVALPMLGVAAACLWLLDDLRRGGLVLAVAGIGLGLVARFTLARGPRMAGVIVLLVGLTATALGHEPTRARVVSGLTSAAQIHAGHVFTVGHAYKLLDDGFYMHAATPATLTEPQAFRFLVRAVTSFLVTPLPWEMTTRGELAFMPEHVVWYGMLLLVPMGLVAGWRRDPLVTSILIAYVIPTALALAVTNGNVGTLLRLRGLVTPYLVWLSALGLLAIVAAILDRRGAGAPTSLHALTPERPVP